MSDNKKKIEKKIELRISIYGVKGEWHKVESYFYDLSQDHLKPLNVHALLINHPDSRVSDLGSNKREISYIIIKCGDGDILETVKGILSKDKILSGYSIDYQKPEQFTNSGHIS